MSQPVHIADVIERWVHRRDEWTRLGASVNGGALALEVIADLEAIAANDGAEELNLTAAAALSGYSADHLARLIREKKLRNYGRKGAPKVRRNELPMRPSALVSGNGIAYDAAIDARLSLSARR